MLLKEIATRRDMEGSSRTFDSQHVGNLFSI